MRRAGVLLLFGACHGGMAASESAGTGGASTSTTASPTTSPASFATSTNSAGTGGSTGAGEEATGFPPPMTETGDPTGDPTHTLHFAVIGDYGLDGTPTAQVADRVASWNPEMVITTGDNNYFDGLASTIDANIGKYYRGFISPYVGTYGAGAAENRFFPCPGNHDWRSGTLGPYLDYFTLPGNERYYAVRRGPVEFFMLDSDYHEPDGLTPTQAQGQWLAAALAESTASFQVVVMHHAPYSSGFHAGTKAMRWPYAAWGADLVLAGHDHDYERLVIDGLDYVVTGTGGAALRKFVAEEPGSQRGHANGFGALRAEANEHRLTLDFMAVDGDRVDRLTIAADPPTLWSTRVATGATWRWRETPPGEGWDEPDFVDDEWAAGPAPLGFGVGGEATLLPGGTSEARPMTTYFRHRFTASTADLGPWLRLRLALDDGAVVYLNGMEVYRINLPEGPLDGATPASLAVGNWFAERLAQTMISGDALVAGDNVLAVEVHQQAPTSGDLHLELELAVGVD